MTNRLTNTINSLHTVEAAHGSVISMSNVDLRAVGSYWRLISLKRARVARLMLAAS